MFWIVNALRIATHPTHQNLEAALAVARRIQGKEDVLYTHES